MRNSGKGWWFARWSPRGKDGQVFSPQDIFTSVLGELVCAKGAVLRHECVRATPHRQVSAQRSRAGGASKVRGLVYTRGGFL